jgi:glutamine amidotransferase
LAHDSAALRQEQPRAPIAVAHVRRATQGALALRNTQPFVRELGGRLHLFAHNGMVPGIEAHRAFRTHRFRRVGDTDSEHAFCALMERLAPLWDAAPPAEAARLGVLRAFASELAELGPANFVYSDGDFVVAHGHRRRHDDGTIRAPGLHLLCRTCSVGTEFPSFSGLEIDPSSHQEVALVASVPLSREPWSALAEGELVVLRDGRVTSRLVG